jgi:hypothetical protein
MIGHRHAEARHEVGVTAERSRSVDFARGWCVAGMLLHHTLNYFPLAVPLIKYARFVTGAFPFLAGFIIGHHYLRIYPGSGRAMVPRLILRALKLLAVFLCLNFITRILPTGRVHWGDWTRTEIEQGIFLLFVSGNYRYLDFDLLVPIAYTLLLGGVLARALGSRPWLIHLLAVALVIGVGFLPDQTPGSYYLRYTTIGLLGLSAGMLPQGVLEAAVSRLWPAWTAIYVAHLAVVPWVKFRHGVYVLVVLLNLTCAYALGAKLPARAFIVARLCRLGQYSLLAYVVQVGLLRFLSAALHWDWRRSDARVSLLGFVTACLGTVMLVELMNAARRWNRWMDRVYRWVFG